MLHGVFADSQANSLMGDYASLLGDAILRHRARVAEHSARIEAELASKVKSEFISNMSHELRTPLNTIIGFSKILSEHDRRKLEDNTVVEYSGLIQDAASHLLSIINDILDISKIQSGKYTLDARELNIDEIVATSIRSFKVAASEAEVELKHSSPPDIPRIRGDDKKLMQVLSNLISNAIKFTRPGGLVTLSTMRMQDDGVAVIVSDNGVGMSDEEAAIALTPFGQVDGSRTRWREGTGLGLPIAKALAELHGGELKIRSIKGKGTEVALILPSRHAVSITQGRDVLLAQSIPN